MLKKVFRLLNLKLPAAFIAAFLLGAGINSLTGNYWFYFTIAKTFTKAEAESKLNRRVVENCFNKSEPTKGTVVSYHRDNSDRGIFVDIKWDKPIFGRYEKISESIETYSRCITEIDATNK